MDDQGPQQDETTPEQELMKAVLHAMSEYRSRAHSEAVKRGIARARARRADAKLRGHARQSHVGEVHAVAYARCASRTQSDQRPIDRQLRQCRQTAKRIGATIDHEFIDDGASGASMDRPGLRQLMEYISSHPTHYVICASPTRLARNPRHFVELVNRADALGTKLEFATPRRARNVTANKEANAH